MNFACCKKCPPPLPPQVVLHRVPCMEALPSLQVPELPDVPPDATTVTLTRDQVAGLFVVISTLRGYITTQLARCAGTANAP